MCSTLCAIMLLASAMQTYAAQGLAIDPSRCKHTNTEIVQDIFLRYDGSDSTGHWEVWRRTYECSDCGISRGTQEDKIRCGHSYGGNPYDDLGHGNLEHKYRVRCSCGYSWQITVPCDGNGSHTKP